MISGVISATRVLADGKQGVINTPVNRIVTLYQNGERGLRLRMLSTMRSARPDDVSTAPRPKMLRPMKKPSDAKPDKITLGGATFISRHASPAISAAAYCAVRLKNIIIRHTLSAARKSFWFQARP